MSNEASKSRPFFEAYLRGAILDIGCGNDPITESAARWDLPQGDAELMEGLLPESFDTICSFHCLEHLRNPSTALARWWALLRPGGHLLIAVPDEDAYEQGIWPSQLNTDHKSTWTTSKDSSWSPASYNLADLLRPLPGHRLERLERRVVPSEELDPTSGDGLAQVEVVIHKLGEPLELRSSLRQLFACPQCRREVIAVGLLPSGALSCRCARCGTKGEYSLE